MFHIILVSPEIPSNTGNIIRLTANTGSSLHLVKPFSFELDDKRLKRAGLDYHEWADLKTHDSLEEAIASTGTTKDRCFALSSKGQRNLGQIEFQDGDCFIFGRESAGLKPEEWDIIGFEQSIRLPMLTKGRSLNLANSVAVTIYEAWRHTDYQGGI